MLDFLSEAIEGDHISLKSGTINTGVKQGTSETISWTRTAPGIITFEPNATTDKSVVISVGIHGNETAPIEIVCELVSKLLSGELSPKVRLLVIIGNLQAIRCGERYLTVDMNRLFSEHYQDHKPCYETKRAQQLQTAMKNFYNAADHSNKLHFDLHTAIRDSHHLRFGLLPYLNSGQYDADMINWLQNIGLEAVVVNHAPAATFSYFSSNEFAAASCTLELGKARPFNQNNLQQFSIIEQGLVNLISGQKIDSNNHVTSQPVLQAYKVAEVIIKSSEQFKLNLADDVKNFTAFNKDFVLCGDGNNGDDGHHQYKVKQEIGYILFPNNHVKVGFRAGLLLEKFNLSDMMNQHK